MILHNRKITLAVTASIAIYKACELVRLLRKAGAGVQVIMTVHAARMISPQVFGSLTGRPVRVESFGYDLAFEHLDPVDDCDCFVVAPATANFLGKAAGGIADDLVTTAYLAMDATRVVIAPAMNCRMYEHGAVQTNLSLLKKRGNRIVEAESGELACGDTGRGRLASLETVVQEIESCLTKQDMTGKRVIVTAGPTQENIDPVRFISNRSSGTMGYLLAAQAAKRGAEVVLISGPVQLKPPVGVCFHEVISAVEMAKAAQKEWPGAHLFIGAAAVSDFCPAQAGTSKLKKSPGRGITLELKQNPDIIAEIAATKKRGQIVVGFALETDHVLEHAKAKLKAKKLDLIVANDTSSMGGKTGSATIISSRGVVETIARSDKEFLAMRIIDLSAALLKSKKG